MASVTKDPQPLRPYWHKGMFLFSENENKEIIGFPSLLNWHCGGPMRRVIVFEKNKNTSTVSNLGCRGWICQGCEKRINIVPPDLDPVF